MKHSLDSINVAWSLSPRTRRRRRPLAIKNRWLNVCACVCSRLILDIPFFASFASSLNLRAPLHLFCPSLAIDPRRRDGGRDWSKKEWRRGKGETEEDGEEQPKIEQWTGWLCKVFPSFLTYLLADDVAVDHQYKIILFPRWLMMIEETYVNQWRFLLFLNTRTRR